MKIKHLKMKLSVFLTFFCVMQMTAATGFGQERINIDVKNASLDEILEEIKVQTDYRFFFEKGVINLSRKMSLKVRNETVENVLGEMFSDSPISFTILKDQIVFTRKPPERLKILEPSKGLRPLPLRRVMRPVTVNLLLTITGKVTDRSGDPLIGVNIQVKGTTRGTVTDFDGGYSIDAGEDDVLIFSYIGYQSLEVPVDGQPEVNVKMVQDAQTLDELIVVGYGTVKKSDLTGSVERVDAEAFRNQSMTQLTDMLTGTVAGFIANQSTSAAGGSSMQIRGPNSLNASTEPMVVLDGVIYNGSIRDINPNDIETIDILKDASSAAIFGARAASGVILITTTKGQAGKPVINFSANVGMAEATNRSFAVRSPDEYLTMRRDYFTSEEDRSEPFYYWYDPENLPDGITVDEWRNAGNNPDSDNTKEWLNRLNFWPTEVSNFLEGTSIDWSDEVLQKGIRQEANLSVSGGSDNSNYYWSLGYVENDGIIRGDKYTNIRMRLNVDFDITKWLNVGANIQYSNRDQSAVPASLSSMYRTSPYGDIWNEDRSIKWYPNGYIGAPNPLLNYFGQDRDYKLNNLFGTLFTNVTLPFGIEYKVSFQPRIESYRNYNYWSPETITGGQQYPGGRSTRADFSRFEWMVDNILKWNREFGSHNVDVTLLYNGEFNRSWFSNSSNQTFRPSPVLGYSGIQFGTNPSTSANDTKVTGDAFLARLNYSFLNRYLLTTSVRRDGYSAFGQENPRAVFPAAAIAWRISSEKFFNSTLINLLKIRLSWGKNGNREIGAYSALARMSSNQYYDGSGVVQGIFTSRLSNSGLRWEETESINLGVDIGIWDYRVNLTLDYYDMNTSNLLVNRTLPKITGFESITTNIGKLANKGFEITLRSKNINSKNFNWKSNVNFSLNRNKIISLFGDEGEYVLEGENKTGEIPDYSNEWFPDYAIDRIWDYDIVGIWQVNEADIASEYTLFPGDFKARDLDGNGAYEALQDKTFIGYSQPRFRLGLRNEFNLFKDFDLSIFLRADIGHLRQFSESINSSGKGAFVSFSTADYPYWSIENSTQDWPRLYTRTAAFGGGINFYKPASFIRIQDISLSYNLANSIENISKLMDFRIFCSVRNLISFDSWPGWDPESVDSPMPRIYNLGFNVSF